MNSLLSITLLLPVAGILFLVLANPKNRAVLRAIALTSATATAAAAVALGILYHRTEGGLQFLTGWGSTKGIVTISFGLDGLSLPLAVVAALVGLAALLASDPSKRDKEFYILALATIGTSIAAFASRNLFFFYFFCDVTTIPKYLLTAAWGRQPDGRISVTPTAAAMQVTLYIAAGAMSVLIGLCVLYGMAGNLDFDTLREQVLLNPLPARAQLWIYGALLLGFGIWSSMWPFHTWSPQAYAAAPAPASMLFAGVLKNFGAYGLLRIGLEILPAGARAWAGPTAAIAIVNILYGGWAAMRQKDWAYIIAYSSVSHIGYLLLAVAACSAPGVTDPALGLSAAILFMAAHGLSVALLFALSGLLDRAAGTRWVPDLGGLGRALPFVSIGTAIAVIAASGLPGFANFVAEVLVFVTAWKAGGPLFMAGAAAAVWGIVITATYFFRALRNTFYGEQRAPAQAATPPAACAKLAVALLIVLSVILGVWPRLVTDTLKLPPVDSARGAHASRVHRLASRQTSVPDAIGGTPMAAAGTAAVPQRTTDTP
jgi:NADH-quinone oxidoreductase subunit M